MSSTRPARSIDAALRRKGFARSVDSDHVVYRFFSPAGELLTRTKMSHGMRETLSVNLMSLMARQLRLTKSQFLNLIDCTMDENGYRDILNNQ